MICTVSAKRTLAAEARDASLGSEVQAGFLDQVSSGSRRDLTSKFNPRLGLAGIRDKAPGRQCPGHIGVTVGLCAGLLQAVTSYGRGV